MRTMLREIVAVASVSSSLMLSIPAWADSPRAEPAPVGVVAAVQGTVYAPRPWLPRPAALERHQLLYDDDVIQTLPRSRAKLLLNDDTLVAIGEDSRIQILEHVEDGAHDSRIVVIKLSHGRVRVLVGRKFTGPGSRVELQTPTGVVSANEGSFAAWIESAAATADSSHGSMGVTNIGRAPISFSASGQMVTLISGQSSSAQPRRPPAPPELVRTAIKAVNRAVQETQLRDGPARQSPREALLAIGAVDRALPAKPAPARTGGGAPPIVPITPPAVISGAVSGETPVSQPSAPAAPAPTVSATATGGSTTPTPTVTPPTIPSLPQPTIFSGSGSGSSGSGSKKGKGKG